MFNSKITVNEFGWQEEMLIPKVIGAVDAGYSSIRRLDRNLAVGHRRRGDVGLDLQEC